MANDKDRYINHLFVVQTRSRLATVIEAPTEAEAVELYAASNNLVYGNIITARQILDITLSTEYKLQTAQVKKG